MRGGLGKTLLIAFLLLAIVPLSVLALFTNKQIQGDTGQKILASLETVVALKEAHVVDWVVSYERELSLLANELGPSRSNLSGQNLATDLSDRLAAMQRLDPAWVALIVVDQASGEVIASTFPERLRDSIPKSPSAIDLQSWQLFHHPAPSPSGSRRLIITSASAMGHDAGTSLLAINHMWAPWQLIALLSGETLQEIITASGDPDVTTCLMTGDGLMISSQGLTQLPKVGAWNPDAIPGGGPRPDGQEAIPQDMLEALQGRSGSGLYGDPTSAMVFSAYRWNPGLQVALLSRQSQTQALATGNALTAMVVGATLAVALITAAIAAVVTRRVTRPIVQLTETAACMARGDLDQRVTISPPRQDEIGILARAFNRMAAELRTLYLNLEAKVAERTQQLEAANQRASYHVMQLTISAEVARFISSIRDLDTLLSTVVELIGNAFELHHASIYLLDDRGEWVTLRGQAGSSDDPPALPGQREAVGGASLVGRVAADGCRRVVRAPTPDVGAGEPRPYNAAPERLRDFTAAVPPVHCEMAVPLRVRGRVLGVIDLQSSRPDDFDDSDQMVYQSLADQISIAIENARAYAVERETVKKLRELDRIQSQFLTNMSHALRTPLNSVIGFSRVMLKELDGPLNDLQHADLTAIHDSGRQLLGLINDMLELSQLDLGTAPLTIAEVDLAEIIEGVMATARALARGKPVQLYEELPPDLPVLHTDGQRLRQVILALLSNAVKFTAEGSIRLRANVDVESRRGGVTPPVQTPPVQTPPVQGDHVTISISDTGIGISPAEWAMIFRECVNGVSPRDETDSSPSEGERTPGFGLAISKRVVEKLGGQIWVESQEGVGSTFTFTLPIKPAEADGRGNPGRGNPAPTVNREEVL